MVGAGVTQPRNASSVAGKRFYTWRNENYWSVTTILSGGVPKPALLPWGIKSVAEGVITQRDVLEAMLAKCEPPQDCAKGHFCPNCDRTIRYLKGVPYSARDRAADLGTYLHAATEAHTLGKPFPTWPPAVRPRMKAFQQYVTDYQPDYHLTEASVYNRTEHYAGTLDAIVQIGERTLLLDTKSGKGVYPEVALQLAAYRNAEFIGFPDGSEEPMRPVDGAVVLHLRDNEYDLIEVDAGPAVFRSFLYCREVFRWQEEGSKQALLGPYNDVAVAAAQVAAQQTLTEVA